MLPAAVYVCNADAVIVAFNQRAAELWGRTPEVGDTDEQFCGAHKLLRPDGSLIPPHEAPMEWVLRTGGHARNMEVIIEQPDGARSNVLVNISPVFDEAGIQIGAVNCFQDVTFQKDAEKERLRLNDQLRQSQKLEAMGDLIGGVAHDFNNLLTPIMAGLDMAQRRQFGDEQERRMLDGALLSTVRAKKIVERLLGLEREQPLQSTAVDVTQLVGGMTELIASAIGLKIALLVATEPDQPSVDADANEPEMAIRNLAASASPAAVTPVRRVALVVDDEALIRMCTADMLVELGYEAVEADSAEAALALLDGGLSIDVLITDHLMRGMTGSVLARRLRERQDTPILIVSGFTGGDEIPAEFHRLDKPFRQSDLASSLARLMAPAA